MKLKIILITLLSIYFSNIWAQEKQISSYELKWKGVEKWYAGSLYTKFVTFDGARYPAENRLPYFSKKLSCDSAAFYEAEVVNPKFVTLTSEESDLIGDNVSQTQLVIQSKPIFEEGKNSIEVQIFPFLNKDGKINKLQSFDLQLKKKKELLKAPVAIRNTYTTSSVLSQGKFVKIRISESGVYKLTYEDLNSMGITPANVRIFGYGGGMLEQNFGLPKIDDLPESAIWMEKGSDGVFNAGDYILFYGQGVTKWSYDKSKSMFTHIINPYAKYGYYFVTSDAGTGKRIDTKTIEVPISATINTVTEFTDYQVHEKELRNLTESGKEFYGETFNDITSYNLSFSFPNPVITNSTLARLDVAASASANSTFTLLLNGGQSKNLSVGRKTDGDNYEQAKGASGIYAFTPIDGNFTYNLTFNKPASSAIGFLNYLEVNVRRQLKMSGSAMQFQNVDYLGSGTYNQYQLSDASNNIQVWDITDQQNIGNITTVINGGVLSFTAPATELKNYIAIDPTAKNAFPSPAIEGVVPNQNIHAINQADLVILTHPDFLEQAQRLAQVHREKDNLTVEVVTTTQVYNEFSSGTPDATAYRWIMKMLYDRAGNNKADLPKYLLLFGRGSYDNRDILSNSGDKYILTYQAENSLVTTLSYVTDDYFGILKDNQGSQVPSDSVKLGIGRLPVSNVTQATNVVNKIIGYINNDDKGNWKNQICFLADDGDAALHMKQADSIAVSIARSYPAFQIDKIYLDAYLQEVTASGQSYPLAKSKFQNLLRSGLFLLDYTGHAGATGWGNEGILTIADVKSLSNQHLPLIVGATCDFLQFDVHTVSAGEQVLLNPSGGGIGMISAARPVYASQNLTLNKLFCENLFKKRNGEQMRVGEVLALAKNSVGTEINKLSYIYMGDPALKLNYPTKFNVITSKINESTTFGNDTLRALSVATIQGSITDNAGNTVIGFNGTVHVVIYDKVQRITTLNNENDGALTYSDRPNTLFSGNAEVKNGMFSFSFMLPKDIKYNYGGGRINYYAEDVVNNNEAQGFFENFVIGGTNRNNTNETDGPTVNLFLNSENFVSGNKVNETPLFMANVADIDGINTVGSGIGHDVMLTIDQDPTQSYVLNDYFRANANSYTDGVVKYKLPEMVDGKHTLTFRVWDLLNNSSTSNIDFEVVKGLTPIIFNVYNYPNPVKSSTNIVVEHDRPETILNTTVEVFDLAGRKIWSFSQSSADKISWDLVSNEGIKVKTGVYFYRVNIKTTDSDISSKTNKMLIIEQ
jgi:hypothetical protein